MHQGFPREGLRFLAELARNNTTEWFRANKERYDRDVKAPMVSLVEAVNESLDEFAPAYTGRKPGTISRQNRDTRFSKDKSPYRTDIAAVFPRDGREKHEAAGFFFRIAPSGGEMLGGVYMPGPDQLRKLRKYIAANHKKFVSLLEAKALASLMGEVQGEELKRVPKEYDAEHPAGLLLRKTQLYFQRQLGPKIVTSSKLHGEIVKSFRAMTPFVETLDEALGNR